MTPAGFVGRSPVWVRYAKNVLSDDRRQFALVARLVFPSGRVLAAGDPRNRARTS
jgi:hypothetical protein